MAALSAHAVQFVVVGGIGAQLHGATRVTMDLDVCVPWARENFERLASVLNDLDARLDLPPELVDLEVPASSELLERTAMTRWHMVRAPGGVIGGPVQFTRVTPPPGRPPDD